MVRAHVPVRKVRGSRRDGRLMLKSLLTGMVAVGGRPRLGEVSEGRPCAAVCVRYTFDSILP